MMGESQGSRPPHRSGNRCPADILCKFVPGLYFEVCAGSLTIDLAGGKLPSVRQIPCRLEDQTRSNAEESLKVAF